MFKSVTPEPDSNEDSSDFMYDGIMVEQPSPTVPETPNILNINPITVAQTENTSSPSSVTSFSSRETARRPNGFAEENTCRVEAESGQTTTSDGPEKVNQRKECIVS